MPRKIWSKRKSPPRQYQLSLEEIESLLDEADGVDGSSNGASANGSDPGATD